MPAKITPTGNGKYRVSTPNGVHAKGTTKAKAESQQRLLNAVDHGWKPTGKPKNGTTGQGSVPANAKRRVHHSPTMTEVDHQKMSNYRCEKC